MVGTILPIGYGERRQGRPPFAVTLHVVSYFAGAATADALIGWLGLLIHPPLARLSPEALLGLLAIATSLHDAGLIRVPFPEAKRQVPARLRFALKPWRLALTYGFELKTGLTTFGSTAAFYVVLAIAIVVGSPLTAVVILLPYAAGRALPFLYFAIT